MTDTPTPTPPIIPGVDEPVGWESVTFEPAEIAITVIIYLGFAILLVVHLYGLTFARTYRPLQARQPILSFVSLLCAILWQSASLFAVRVIPYHLDPTILVTDALCMFVNNWLEWIGCYAFVLTCFFRMWRLFLVFKFKRSWRPMHLYGPTAILGIISLAAILFIQFEPGFTTHQLVTGELICWATWNEIYVSLAMALILIISIITVAVINRKIPLKHFNEYRLTLISFGVCLVAWVFALVLGLLSLQYRLWGRIVFSLLITVVGYYGSTFSVAGPIYHHLTDRSEYEHQFRIDMKQDTDDSSANSNPGSRDLSKNRNSKHAASGQSLDKRAGSHDGAGSTPGTPKLAAVHPAPTPAHGGRSNLDADGIIREFSRMSQSGTGPNGEEEEQIEMADV